MSRFITLCLLFFSAPAWALTETQSLIQHIQKNYADKHKGGYPILILDRDEIEWELAQRRLYSDDVRLERFAFIQEYIRAKTGVSIDINTAGNIDSYAALVTDSALAMPFPDLIQLPNVVKYNLCVVFPASTNSNRRLETERILGMSNREVYSENFDHVRHKISYNEMQLFSILHELGHCIDRKFMPDAYRYPDTASVVHLSESFAETFSTLAMAREGFPQIAERRALLRSVYSSRLGPYYATHPELSFGNPVILMGGAVYYLSPILRAAQKHINLNSPRMSKINIDQLIATAEQIVDKNALDVRAITAIGAAQANGRETIVAQYARMASDWPDLFTDAYNQLLSYFVITDRDVQTAFDPSAPAAPVRGQLTALDWKSLCSKFKSEDKKAFFAEIQNHRTELESEADTPERQRQVAEQLRGALRKASETCP